MRVEDRADGSKIIRPGRGHQRLCVATSHPQEVVVLSELGEVISCRRHYDEELKKTVPCTCVGPCYTQRLDRFLAVLLRTGPVLWEERILVLAANGWGALQASAIGKGLDPLSTRGLLCIVQRRGDSTNGRTSCQVQSRVAAVPGGFDLPEGLRACTGIAADFFGDSDGEAFPQELIPARTRAEKPRVPLGRKQG